MKIAVLIFDRTSESSLFLTLNAFQYLRIISPRFPLEVVKVGARRSVTLLSGIRMQTDMNFALKEKFDAILVPGIFFTRSEQFLEFFKSNDAADAIRFLRFHSSKNTVIASSCGGTVLLAEAGMLEKKRATSIWWLRRFLLDRYPNIDWRLEDLVVRDGKIMTAGPAFSHADLLSLFLNQLLPAKTADLFRKYTVLPERRKQMPFFDIDQMAQHDLAMKRLLSIVDQRLSDPELSVQRLAKTLGMSERTLHRRVTDAFGWSPQKLLTKVRCQKAIELLSNKDLSIENVSEMVGYCDARVFRRAFKMEFDESPNSYRS